MPFIQETKGSSTTPSNLRSEILSRSHAGHLRHHGRNSNEGSGLGSRSVGSEVKRASSTSRRSHALGRRSNKKRCTKKSSNNADGSSSKPSSTSSASSAGSTSSSSSNSTSSSSGNGNCFPALGFKMPSDTPSSTDNWWCDQDEEYAFVSRYILEIESRIANHEVFVSITQLFFTHLLMFSSDSLMISLRANHSLNYKKTSRT